MKTVVDDLQWVTMGCSGNLMDGTWAMEYHGTTREHVEVTLTIAGHHPDPLEPMVMMNPRQRYRLIIEPLGEPPI